MCRSSCPSLFVLRFGFFVAHAFCLLREREKVKFEVFAQRVMYDIVYSVDRELMLWCTGGSEGMGGGCIGWRGLVFRNQEAEKVL